MPEKLRAHCSFNMLQQQEQTQEDRGSTLRIARAGAAWAEQWRYEASDGKRAWT
ncbi:MAG: hypothetical protein KDK91_18840 [Gammaproteobacteria bacterium]|nr:hypothetical protein [Gammaproteobacteria bacterium]